MRRIIETITVALGCFAVLAFQAGAQSARIRDITMADGSMPVRLLGYGIVVGLDGTGDRGIGGQQGGQTVQSVANLLRRFDTVCTSSDVAHPKPAPDIYLLAANRLRVEPGQCLVLEDSPTGVRAALAAGMTPIQVPDLLAPDEEVRALGHRIVASLADAQRLLELRLEAGG